MEHSGAPQVADSQVCCMSSPLQQSTNAVPDVSSLSAMDTVGASNLCFTTTLTLPRQLYIGYTGYMKGCRWIDRGGVMKMLDT